MNRNWFFFFYPADPRGRSTRNSNPVMTSSTGGAKGCSDHRFHAPLAYTAQLLTLHQRRANNQYRTANQIYSTLWVSSSTQATLGIVSHPSTNRAHMRTGISKLISRCTLLTFSFVLSVVATFVSSLRYWVIVWPANAGHQVKAISKRLYILNMSIDE